MGGNFGHFFFGAEVDGEGGGVFGEEDGEPSLIFFRVSVAKAGFDRDGETARVGDGVFKAFDGEVGSFNHGGATAGGVDVAIGAAEVEVDARKTERSERGGKFRKMGGIFAPNLGDNRGVGGGDFEAFERVSPAFFRGERGDVGEFGEEEVGAAGLCNYLAENNVRDAFHGGEAGDGGFKFVPDIHTYVL